MAIASNSISKHLLWIISSLGLLEISWLWTVKLLMQSILLTFIQAQPEKDPASMALVEVEHSQRCQLHTASSMCHYYHLIDKPRFHAFLPQETLGETCAKMESALRCVDKLLPGCHDRARIFFDTQRDVLQAVCRDRREDFLESGNCFSSTILQESVSSRCLVAATNQKLLNSEPCRLVKIIIYCAAKAVRMTDGCTLADAEFMADLVDIYLAPSIGFICNLWKAAQTTYDSGLRDSTVTTTYRAAANTTTTTQKPVQQPQQAGKSQKDKNCASYSVGQQSLLGVGLVSLAILILSKKITDNE